MDMLYDTQLSTVATTGTCAEKHHCGNQYNDCDAEIWCTDPISCSYNPHRRPASARTNGTTSSHVDGQQHVDTQISSKKGMQYSSARKEKRSRTGTRRGDACQATTNKLHLLVPRQTPSFTTRGRCCTPLPPPSLALINSTSKQSYSGAFIKLYDNIAW